MYVYSTDRPWSRIPINLQLFAEGDGGGATSAAGTGTGETTPSTSGGAGTDATTGNQAGGQQGQDKTFTQADVDRIVQERLARERDKYKDYDQIKADAEAYRQQQEASKSELQKAQEKAQKAETEKAQALVQANERLIKAEVKLVSVELGIVDPDAAYALMDRTNVKVRDDGTVAGVKEALEALLKTKTYLKKQGGSGGVGSPGGNPGDKQVDEAAEAKKLAEERQKAPTRAGGYDPWATK
jgi:hypothetical protein